MLEGLPSTWHPNKIPRAIAHCISMLFQPKCFLSLSCRSSAHFSFSFSFILFVHWLLQFVSDYLFAFLLSSWSLSASLTLHSHTHTTSLPGFLCLPCAHPLHSADCRKMIISQCHLHRDSKSHSPVPNPFCCFKSLYLLLILILS